MIRLILHSDRHGSYSAVLEGSAERLVKSRQPLYDGARELLKRGVPLQTLLTMRHAGSQIDSWVATPIAELAKWTIREGPSTPIRKRRWKAMQAGDVRLPVRLEAEGVSQVPGEGQDALAGLRPAAAAE
jgi:hypothetical protein